MPFGGFQKAIATGAWVNQRLLGGEDYIESMWRAYKDEVKVIPLQRPRRAKKGDVTTPTRRFYKAPSYASFRKYIYALHRLGLLELTREEPVTTVITMTGKLARYPSAIPRHYFAIAPGMATDPMWDNPIHWAFVAARKVPAKIAPPKVAPPAWKPLTLDKSPTKAEISKLIRHLESLRGLEHEPPVVKELDRLAYATGNWVFALEERIKRLTGSKRVEAEALLASIDKASEAIGSYDLQSAIRHLEAIS